MYFSFLGTRISQNFTPCPIRLIFILHLKLCLRDFPQVYSPYPSMPTRIINLHSLFHPVQTGIFHTHAEFHSFNTNFSCLLYHFTLCLLTFLMVIPIPCCISRTFSWVFPISHSINRNFSRSIYIVHYVNRNIPCSFNISQQVSRNCL